MYDVASFGAAAGKCTAGSQLAHARPGATAEPMNCGSDVGATGQPAAGTACQIIAPLVEHPCLALLPPSLFTSFHDFSLFLSFSLSRARHPFLTLFLRAQAQMRDQVAKFEKFIRENDAKRTRAEAKAKAEKAAYRTKCREQEKLAEDLVATELECEALIEQLVRLKKYHRYLEKTVAVTEDADEVWDLLNRHKTLRSANEDLMGQVTGSATERGRGQ